jgi:hypothetical protein
MNPFKLHSTLCYRTSHKGYTCHDPNPGFMIGNIGAVSKGHPTYAKPQNRHIKRTSYSKIRSIL